MTQDQKARTFNKWTPKVEYTQSFKNAIHNYLSSQYFFVEGRNFDFKHFINFGYMGDRANCITRDIHTKEDFVLDILYNTELENHMLTLVEAVALVLANIKIKHYNLGGAYTLSTDIVYKGFCNLQAFFNRYDLPYLVPELTYEDFMLKLTEECDYYDDFIQFKAEDMDRETSMPIAFGWRTNLDKNYHYKITRRTQVPFFTLKEINGFYFIVIEKDTIYNELIYCQIESFARVIFHNLSEDAYNSTVFFSDCWHLVSGTDIYESQTKLTMERCESVRTMEKQRIEDSCKAHYAGLKTLIASQYTNVFVPEINYRLMVAVNKTAEKEGRYFRFVNYTTKPEPKETEISWLEGYKEAEAKKKEIRESERYTKEKSKKNKVLNKEQLFMPEVNRNKYKEKKEGKSEGKNQQKEYLNKSLEELDKSLTAVSSTIKSLKSSLDKLEGTLTNIKGRCDTLEEEFKQRYGDTTDMYKRKKEDQESQEDPKNNGWTPF